METVSAHLGLHSARVSTIQMRIVKTLVIEILVGVDEGFTLSSLNGFASKESASSDQGNAANGERFRVMAKHFLGRISFCGVLAVGQVLKVFTYNAHMIVIRKNDVWLVVWAAIAAALQELSVSIPDVQSLCNGITFDAATNRRKSLVDVSLGVCVRVKAKIFEFSR